MTKNPKRPRDPSQLAKMMVDIASGEASTAAPSLKRAKAGSIGGKIRSSQLTPEQRTEAAKLAARARWRKKP